MTAAEISAWAFIELTSKPNCLRRFTLIEIAEGTHVSLTTAKRAVTRLAQLGMIFKRRRAHGLWLCPTTQPFEQGAHDGPGMASHKGSDRPALTTQAVHDRPPLTTVIAPNVLTTSSEPAPKDPDSQKEKLLKNAVETDHQEKRDGQAAPAPVDVEAAQTLAGLLQSRLNVWERVGLHLIEKHGLLRVREVYTAVTKMAEQGKAHNPAGLLQDALKHGRSLDPSAKPPVTDVPPQAVKDAAISALLSLRHGREIDDRQRGFIDRYRQLQSDGVLT